MEAFKLICCLLLLSLSPLFAQKVTPAGEISGIVLDSASRKPLRIASVSLLHARDSAYVTATTTGGEGDFRFKKVAPGLYRLLVTFMGYKNISMPITVVRDAPLDVGELLMTEQGTQLNEIVIKQERAPVTIRQDTIEFNAGSFKTQPNAQVEELLRKLPGVEVARDGSIKANGQAVNKVLVDGKPFFGNDPKMATRNLPADIVDKVQMYDQSSDQSQFSGVDDGDRERTINITIKKDKGKGYFGQNALGAGPKSGEQSARYEAKLNVNRFNNHNGGPNRQISVIGQANNLNQQNFNLSEGGGGPQFIGQPGGGDGGPVAPSNITEVAALGANYRTESNTVKWGKRPEMAASYFASRAVTTTDQQSHRENILPGQSFLTDQHNYSKNTLLTHRINGRFDLPIDSLTSLRFTPNISFQTKDLLTQSDSYSYRSPADSLNRGLTRYDLDGTGLNGYNNLLLMRKFRKEGRSLSANLNSTLTTGNTTAYNRSVNTFFDTLTTQPRQRIDQRNAQDQFSMQNTVTVSFTEPISFTKKLEFRYAYSNNFAKLLRNVVNKTEETDQYDQPDGSLSRNFANTFETNRLGATFQTRRLRYTIALGGDAQLASLRPVDRSTDAGYQTLHTYFMPNALFSYTFRGNRNLRLQYRTRVVSPGITQLIPVADNSNPLNISIGNPALRPEYYHNVTLTFSTSSRGGTDNLFVFGSFNQSNNRIGVSTRTDDSGVQVTTPINTRGFMSGNGFVGLSKKIEPLRLSVNLSTQGSIARNTNTINDLDNVTTSTSLGQGIRLQSDYNGRIDYGLSARITYQQARYSLLSQQNMQYWSQYATGDVHWQLPGNLVITTDLTYTGNTGRAEGYNQRFLLWNASIAKQFLRTKQAEVRLQVFDLLNQNRSLVRNTGDAYIEDVRSRVLKRYFLISLVYNLRKFGV
ncbi:Outer membrane receptor proteins, mostly Fe transport [Dyadobacter sp. SG02]|uniref:TonB-dependent receptor n=1 Tax=Dyadobacter sp. SG02 TaxID=1855291 RepID=UPI0008B7C3B3|nr:TonB-dependent receptor [Dyadobacter sp. SG02]SEI38225.1 Outer membrane receptor proteins, mostly Fe transport [Dyadobacter sp. SG02]